MDQELLLAALSFWCSATNTMVLPLGPIGPTILDVTAILGTSPSGIPVDASLFECSSNVDLKALFEARAVETLSRDGQEPSKEEVPKIAQELLQLQHLDRPLCWSKGCGSPQGGACSFSVLLVQQVHLLYQIEQMLSREHAGGRSIS